MNKGKILISSFLLLGGSLHSLAQTMVVSIPALRTQRNERVVGFEIRVRSGKIAQLPYLPIGWSITVDNDPSWNTTVKGSIAVGAAALDPDFLRGFVIVEKEKDAPPERPFALDGEVFVTADFSTQRTIRLAGKDFHIELRRPSAAAKQRNPGE